MIAISFLLLSLFALSNGFILNHMLRNAIKLSKPSFFHTSLAKTGTGLDIAAASNRDSFVEYYRGMIIPGNEMAKEDFVKFNDVETLLDDGLISVDDIDNLWISAVGDAAGLNEEEAYELLCMVKDLPDPEDIAYLDAEFKKLAGGKETVSYFKFIGWADVQDMIEEEALTMEDVTEMWRDIAGDLNSVIDRRKFGKLNSALDAAIDDNEEYDEDDAVLDVWDPQLDPSTVFDAESFVDMKKFFDVSANSDGLISFEKVSAWSTIRDFVSDGSLTEVQLTRAWEDGAKNGDLVDFETFARFNLKLDLIMDENEEVQAQLSKAVITDTSPSAKFVTAPSAKPVNDNTINDDAESFYRSEFARLTSPGRLLRLDMLLDWSEVKDLLSEGVLTAAQITRMFEGMPKEPMGLPATSFGITEDTFVAFNGMLDVMIENVEAGQAEAKVAAPTALVSEPQRPAPAEAELKFGSLGSGGDQEDSSSTGLSQEELDMMKVLDSADNMLNSGSFGDFDQLIGDVNDPRLAALREKRDGAQEVQGRLQDLLSELVNLGRQQKRCGLDPPDELEEARLRDLVQAVLEKSIPAAKRDLTELRNALNGSWKLLYTNSEMFRFYNGITGFPNVFPGTKFRDLILSYSSDGYLNEATYNEDLATPLGKLDAKAFANWDLVKEMSFMTNENSVVLRSYCSKVSAGPMEYEAQENWKSLRTMSMNELVYVDDKNLILRNCGALRIFFLLERTE